MSEITPEELEALKLLEQWSRPPGGYAHLHTARKNQEEFEKREAERQARETQIQSELDILWFAITQTPEGALLEECIRENKDIEGVKIMIERYDNGLDNFSISKTWEENY